MPTSNLNITTLAPTQTDKVTSINNALEKLDVATQGTLALTGASNYTLTTAQFTSNFLFSLNGSQTGAFSLNVPNTSRLFAVKNNTAFTCNVISVAGTVPVASGTFVVIYGNTAELSAVSGSGGGGGGSSDPETKLDVAMTVAGSTTLTAPQFDGNKLFNLIGTPIDHVILQLPTTSTKFFTVRNSLPIQYDTKLRLGAAGAEVFVNPGKTKTFWTNGTLLYEVSDDGDNDVNRTYNLTAITTAVTTGTFAEYSYFILTGSLTNDPHTLELPTSVSKIFTVECNETGNAPTTIRLGAAGANVLIHPGEIKTFRTDGTIITEVSRKLRPDTKIIYNLTSLTTVVDRHAFETNSVFELTGSLTNDPHTLELPTTITKEFTVVCAETGGVPTTLRLGAAGATTLIHPGETKKYWTNGTLIFPLSSNNPLNTRMGRFTTSSASATVILTTLEFANNFIFEMIGAPAGAQTLQIPSNTPKLFSVSNKTSQSVITRVGAAGATITIPPFNTYTLATNGTAIDQAQSSRLPQTLTTAVTAGTRTLTVAEFFNSEHFDLTGSTGAVVLSVPGGVQKYFSVHNNSTNTAGTVQVQVAGGGASFSFLYFREIGYFYSDGTNIRPIGQPARSGVDTGFVPTVSNTTTPPTGVTYSLQSGRFTITPDRKVQGVVAVTLTAYTAGTGNAIITLPGVPPMRASARGWGYVTTATGITATTGPLDCAVENSAAPRLQLKRMANTGLSDALASSFTATTNLRIEFEYEL